jgi:nucleoside-diphosphate-sugar epimerase
MDINVTGTRNVLYESMAKGVKRFIHVSSVAALGRQKNQRLIDEGNQWVKSPMNSVYAESKYLAELEVFRAQEEGLSAAIINPSVILAPADWNKSSAQLFKYVWKEKSFYTDAFLNYVDVRDVSEVTVQLLDNNFSGRYILNAGKISFYDFFNKVAQRFHKRAPRFKLNPTLLQMAARAEEWRTFVTGDEPLLTRETARLAGTEFLYKNDKIRKTLSIEFQPIDDSLDWCCQYYLTKNVGKILN